MMKRNPHGCSYRKRVEEVNRIFDEYSRRGLPNREIWRRYIWPIYGISERQFYNVLNASADESKRLHDDDLQLLLFPDWEDKN